MTKHGSEREPPDSSSTRGGVPRRGGYGDDQGTRVGSPTPSGREHAGPSTRPVNEGLEGAILDDQQADGDSEREGPTGSGAESARGIHASGSGGEGGGSEGEPGGSEGKASQSGGTEAEPSEHASRSGSEPLRDRTHEHESGYGGAGGRPKPGP